MRHTADAVFYLSIFKIAHGWTFLYKTHPGNMQHTDTRGQCVSGFDGIYTDIHVAEQL